MAQDRCDACGRIRRVRDRINGTMAHDRGFCQASPMAATGMQSRLCPSVNRPVPMAQVLHGPGRGSMQSPTDAGLVPGFWLRWHLNVHGPNDCLPLAVKTTMI